MRAVPLVLGLMMLPLAGCVSADHERPSSGSWEQAEYRWETLDGVHLANVSIHATQGDARLELDVLVNRVDWFAGNHTFVPARQYSFRALVDAGTGELIESRMEPHGQHGNVGFGSINLRVPLGDPILTGFDGFMKWASQPLAHELGHYENTSRADVREVIPLGIQWALWHGGDEIWGPYHVEYVHGARSTKIVAESPCFDHCWSAGGGASPGPAMRVIAEVDAGMFPRLYEVAEHGIEDPRGSRLLRLSHEGHVDPVGFDIRAPEPDISGHQTCGWLPCQAIPLGSNQLDLRGAWTVHELNPEWLAWQASAEVVWAVYASVAAADGLTQWIYRFVDGSGIGRSFSYIQPDGTSVVIPQASAPYDTHLPAEFFDSPAVDSPLQDLGTTGRSWLQMANATGSLLSIQYVVEPPAYTPGDEFRHRILIQFRDDGWWSLKGSIATGTLWRMEHVPAEA